MTLCRFVTGVLAAAPTELTELQPIWCRLLVLSRNVIATLALVTLKNDVIAWHNLAFALNQIHGSDKPHPTYSPIQSLPRWCRRQLFGHPRG